MSDETTRERVLKGKRWITVDPGEDTGVAIWEDNTLVFGTTIKMWSVADVVGFVLDNVDREFVAEFHPEVLHVYDALIDYEIERIVVEDWRIYPWVIYTPDGRATHALDFDQCRTARLIGALTYLAMRENIDLHLQGADIKETAVAAGAEQLFYNPLHPNRHQNDAIMHGVFFLVIEKEQAPLDGRTE